MGQAANSNRRASLDNQKARAAGRQGGREALKNAVKPRDQKGKAGGAFGSEGKANRRAAAASRGEGGGGGGVAPPRNQAGRSTRPARRQSK
jgi:hypothetical protein